MIETKLRIPKRCININKNLKKIVAFRNIIFDKRIVINKYNLGCLHLERVSVILVTNNNLINKKKECI